MMCCFRLQYFSVGGEVLFCFVRFEFVLVNDLGFEKLIVVFVERTIRLGMDIIIESIILTFSLSSFQRSRKRFNLA